MVDTDLSVGYRDRFGLIDASVGVLEFSLTCR